MLTVSNLTKSFGGQVIFDDISFTVAPGEHIGLSGRNGSGKTTLLRLLSGEEEYDRGAISIPKGYSMSHLSQRIHFAKGTVLEEARSNLKFSLEEKDETHRVKSILHGLGFTSIDFDRDPRELSGGFQVRLNLGKILVSQPNLLLLDEPTNYLDIVSARWLARFLNSWRGEFIVVTHDRAFMDSVSNCTMGIHRHKIKKIAGGTDKLFRQILQEEEVYEKTRINDERKRRETEQFINRFKAQASRARAVQSRIRMLEKKGSQERLVRMRDLEFEFSYAPTQGKWLMELDDISFSFYEDQPPLINALSLAVAKGDRIGIIGKNGKGKTTLLNLIAGALIPQTGQVRQHENTKIDYFGQMNVERLDGEKTVLDEILEAQTEYNLGRARNICGAMLFEGDKASKKVSILSGGEKSRVLLGKIIARSANLLLLDEPDNHLDAESVDALIEAVDNFEGAVVIVTHSEMVLNAIATRLIVFDKGKTSLFEGSYNDFIERIGWEDEKEGAGDNGNQEDTPRGLNKKDVRRLRAWILSERSKILGPLQKKIEDLEERITEQEKRVNADNTSLLRASRVGDGRTISSLSVSIYQAKKLIDELFDELEVANNNFHENSKELEKRFQQMDAPMERA